MESARSQSGMPSRQTSASGPKSTRQSSSSV